MPTWMAKLGQVKDFLYRHSFVVHGLWPSSTDRGFLKKMTRGGGDRTCRANVNFNARALSPDIQNQLTRVMPGLSKSPQDLWRHEFDKHGTCSVKLTKDSGSAAPDAQLMVDYFREVINFYNILSRNFRLTQSTFRDVNELGRALNLNPKNFVAVVVSVGSRSVKETLWSSRFVWACPIWEAMGLQGWCPAPTTVQ